MLQQFLKDCEKYEKPESEYSESTVASDIAERKIKLFNDDIINDTQQKVHLHIEALNIYGQTEGDELQPDHGGKVS